MGLERYRRTWSGSWGSRIWHTLTCSPASFLLSALSLWWRLQTQSSYVTSLKQPPFDGRSLYTEMNEVWKYALAATSLKELIIFYLGVVLREMSPNGVYIARNARLLGCWVICMLNIFIIKRHTTLDCYFVINWMLVTLVCFLRHCKPFALVRSTAFIIETLAYMVLFY